jgi:RND family efflux transporter MFP subunit
MSSRRMKQSYAVLIAFVSLIAASGCGHKEGAHRETPRIAVRVQTLAATAESDLVEAAGSIRSGHEATISAKVMGTVTEIRRRAGDSVRRGETILTIDSRDVAGQVAQAEGALAQAKAAAVLAETNFRRFEQLRAKGSASQMEMDQARYQYDNARGAVQQAEGAVATARSYESNAIVPAPFDGRIVDQLCEVGDLAAPGRPLMKIEDPSSLRLYASLDASKAVAATVGAEIKVVVPALADRVFRGRITEVVPAADPSTRSLLLKIDIDPDPSLRSGLYARALLPSGQRTVLRVPRSVIAHRGGITGVFVAESSRAAFRMVVLSTDRPEEPEVRSGLQPGDQVVLDPPSGLEIGSLLEVRP